MADGVVIEEDVPEADLKSPSTTPTPPEPTPVPTPRIVSPTLSPEDVSVENAPTLIPPIAGNATHQSAPTAPVLSQGTMPTQPHHHMTPLPPNPSPAPSDELVRHLAMALASAVLQRPPGKDSENTRTDRQMLKRVTYIVLISIAFLAMMYGLGGAVSETIETRAMIMAPRIVGTAVGCMVLVSSMGATLPLRAVYAFALASLVATASHSFMRAAGQRTQVRRRTRLARAAETHRKLTLAPWQQYVVESAQYSDLGVATFVVLDNDTDMATLRALTMLDCCGVHLLFGGKAAPDLCAAIMTDRSDIATASKRDLRLVLIEVRGTLTDAEHIDLQAFVSNLKARKVCDMRHADRSPQVFVFARTSPNRATYDSDWTFVKIEDGMLVNYAPP